MKFTKRLIALLIAAMLLIGTTPITAYAETLYYLDEDGHNTALSLPAGTSYTTVTDSTTTFYEGWNVVFDDVTIERRIYLDGDAKLLLCDGATLTANMGITVRADESFSIYCQSKETGTLSAYLDYAARSCAAIGSDMFYPQDCGSISIYGGNINAYSSFDAAGIGGSIKPGGVSYNAADKYTCGNIYIKRGKINAKGNDFPGIGGNGGNIRIDGGTINAGVNALGSDAAIGGCQQTNQPLTIEINGGDITANGPSNGTGIGEGTNGISSAITATVTINGGHITAKCSNANRAVIGNVTLPYNYQVNYRKYSFSDISTAKAQERINKCKSPFAEIKPCQHTDAVYEHNVDTHTLKQCNNCLTVEEKGEQTSAHNITNLSYTWSHYNDKVTAECSCNCGNYKETVNTKETVITPSTPTAQGRAKYTATFEEVLFNPQEKTCDLPLAVEYAEAENGKATGVPAAFIGDEVEVTPVPDRFFKPKSVTVKDYYGNTVEVTDNKFTMPSTMVTVSAEFEDAKYPVTYLDEYGEEKTVSAMPLYGNETALYDGWYYLSEDVHFTNNLYIAGDAHLILSDGKTMSFDDDAYMMYVADSSIADELGIEYDSSKVYDMKLNTYWQSGKTGALTNNKGIFPATLNVYGGNISTNGQFGGDYTKIYDGNINVKDELFAYYFDMYGGILQTKDADFAFALNILGGNFSCTGTLRSSVIGYAVFGFDRVTDSIYVNNYDFGTQNTKVKIKDTQKMCNEADENAVYSGELALSDDLKTLRDLNGVKLVPYKSHTINYSACEHGRIVGPKAASARALTQLTVVPEIGYELDTSWYDYGFWIATSNNKRVYPNPSHQFNMPGLDVTVKAKFKIADYSISYDVGEHGTVTGATTAQYNDEITLDIKPEIGYEVETLTVTDSKNNKIDVADGKFSMPGSSVTVTVKFRIADYSINYEVGEHGTVTGATTARYNDEITLDIEPETGYEVETLTVTDSKNNKIDVADGKFSMPSSSVTVTVKFRIADYSINYEVGEHGTVTGATTALYNDEITLDIETETGYEVETLTVTDSDNNKIDVADGKFSMPGSSVTVTVKFKKIDFRVNCTYPENRAGVNVPGTANYNDEVTINITPNAGYVLSSVTVTDADDNVIPVTDNKFIMPLSNVNIVIVLYPITYSITYMEGEHGRVYGDATGTCDSIIRTYTSPDKGYKRDTLTVVDSDGNPVDVREGVFRMPASDVTVSATFKKDNFRIIIYNSEHGSVSYEKYYVTYGDEAKLFITPDTGYELDTLSVKDDDKNEITVTDGTFIMPPSYVTVNATFKQIKRTVKWIVGGLVVETDENQIYGTIPEYNSEPLSDYCTDDGNHYIFCGWNDGTKTYAPGEQLPSVTQDVTYTAVYTLQTEHIYAEPEWIWDESHGTAKALFTCTVPGCRHSETVNASVTRKIEGDKFVSTATVELDGKTFTDVFTEDYEGGVVIVLSQTEGGEIKADKRHANVGDTVTLNFRADEGYTLYSYGYSYYNADGVKEYGDTTSYVYYYSNNSYNLHINDNCNEGGYIVVTPIFKRAYRITDNTGRLNFRYKFSGDNLEYGIPGERIIAFPDDYIDYTSSTDEGYTLDSITVMDEQGNVIETELNSAANFVMPASDITVDAAISDWKYDVHREYDPIRDHGYIRAISSTQLKEGEIFEGKVESYSPYILTALYAKDKDGNRIDLLANGSYNAETGIVSFTMPAKSLTIYREHALPGTVQDKYNLTVEENIDVNVLVDVDGHAANGEIIKKIVYTYPDITTQEKKTVTETVNADDITTDANGYFAKSFTMAIAQANEPITATLYFTNGTMKEIKVSVADYCEYIIDNAEANGYSENLVNLCYTVLEYGKTAVDYFGYEYPDDIAYPEYTLPDEFKVAPEITNQAGIRKGDTVTGIASTQMFILSNATMRITFKDDISGLSVTGAKVGNRELTAEIVEVSSGKWGVDISGIYATELNKPVELTLSDGTLVKYAATDWARSILKNSNNESSKALAKAMYYYSEAANTYFGG